MARLRSARLTDDTLVSQIDDYVGELELSICDIFGFTADSNITESPFSCDNSGRLNRQLIYWRKGGVFEDNGDGGLYLDITASAPAAFAKVGIMPLYFVDTVEDDTPEVINVFGFGNLDLADEDSQTLYYKYMAPTNQFPGFAIRLDTGGLFGNTVTSSIDGLVPATLGAISYFLCGDGTWKLVGRPDTVAILFDFVNGVSAQGAIVASWDDEYYDNDNLHTDLDDEVVIVDEGNYLVTFTFQGFSQDGPGLEGYIQASIYRDRAAADTKWGEQIIPIETVYNESAIQCTAIVPCEAADRLWCQATYYQDGGTQWTPTNGFMTVARIT